MLIPRFADQVWGLETYSKKGNKMFSELYNHELFFKKNNSNLENAHQLPK